jgi:hypothetical protein
MKLPREENSMKINQPLTVIVDGQPVHLKSSAVIRLGEVATAKASGSKGEGIKTVFSGVTGAAVANTAWSGFQASNTLTHEQVVSNLLANGLSPVHAPSAADKILEILRAEPTRILLVAVSAGGGTWVAMETLGKLLDRKWTTRQKLLTSLGGAALAVIVYLVLKWAGILGQAADTALKGAAQ